MTEIQERPRGESDYPPSIVQSASNVASSESQDVSSVNESDSRLEALLDQQARIQAEIKALLPPKNGMDAQQELTMLNHKHKMLKSCQEEHGLASAVLSVEEECRLLQYKCECLEVSCLQSGKYSSVNDLLEKGSLPLRSIQPVGFEDWLHTNASKYDLVLKCSPTGASLGEIKFASLKCSELECAHYIYGFASLQSLENHRQRYHLNRERYVEPHSPSAPSSSLNQPQVSSHFREQSSPRITSSSQRGQPILAAKDPSLATRSPWQSYEPPNDSPRRVPNKAPVGRLSKVKTGCNACKYRRVKCDETRPQCNRCVLSGRICGGYWIMPPLTPVNMHAEAHSISEHTLAKPLNTFSFIQEHPAYSDDPNDYQGNISSHLAKRSRLDTDNRDETNLMREVGPCLRCKILKKKCDVGDPCSLCPEQDSLAESDYWKVLGCHRGSLLSFTEILVPEDQLSHSLGPNEAFKKFATDWWDVFQSRGGKALFDSAEMQDEFGLTWPRHVHDHPDVRLEPLSYLLPPAYILASKRNTCNPEEVGYSLVELLRFSATISGGTVAECQNYSLLTFSKFLLQEAIVFEVSHNSAYEIPAGFVYDRYGILSMSCINFLRSFEDMTQRRSSWGPRTWIAAFCSMCFLRAAVCFLDDGFHFKEHEDFARIVHSNAIHSVYKALVSNFAWSTPSILDDEAVPISLEDKKLLSGLKQILLKDQWMEYGIPSTKDFLIGLGNGVFKDGFFNDFVRQHKPPQRSSTHQRPNDDHDSSSKLIEDVPGAAKPVGPFKDSAPASVSESMYQKPKHERVYCNLCEEHPDGFRGEHELRRHHDRAHKVMIKKWICVEPEENRVQPDVPLSSCKACGVQQKKYGAYYNAAAHLRRTHFRPKARGKSNPADSLGERGGDWPPMSELKHWMKEIEEPAAEFSQIATAYNDDLGSTIGSPMGLPSSYKTSQTSSHLFNSTSIDQIPSSTGSTSVRRSEPPTLVNQTERREKCPITTCDYHTKGFARIYDRNRHTLSHYKGTIVCPFCPGVGTPSGKTFSRADVMKRHLTSVHNVEQAPPAMRMRSKPEIVTAPSGEKGKCSICSNAFKNPQVFYDHLDNCVLAVVASAALSGSSEQTIGPGSGGPDVHMTGD